MGTTNTAIAHAEPTPSKKALLAINAELSSQVRSLEAQNARLQEDLRNLIAHRFGRSSERLDDRQLRLFELGEAPPTDAEPEPAALDPKKPRKARAGHGRNGFPESLPRNEIKIDPPEHERICPCCGDSFVCMRREITERGEIIPAKVVVNRYDTGVWACAKGCVAPKQAAPPASVVPKAKWEPSAYAHVVVSKYSDHVPLHRQVNIFRRFGIDMAKSTLCDMALAVAAAVKVVNARIRQEILGSNVVLADETPLQVMIAKGSKKKRKFEQGYMWVYRTPDGKRIAFDFTTNRSQDGPKEFLGDWKGTLLTDEYSGYDAVCRDNGIVRGACWAHARRRFKDALEARKAESVEALRLINGLFRIERLAEERIDRHRRSAIASGRADLTDDAATAIRVAVRRRWSAPIIDKLHGRLIVWRDDPSIVPKSLLGRAVRYLVPEGSRKAIWDRFTVFLNDGHVPIHNNGAENSIRPLVVGRKNWLFAGSVTGGDASATLHSLMLTCRALDINPEEYLADTLSRLDTATPAQLTPWAWQEERDRLAASPSDAP